MRIDVLAIGSRGDVQPFIALGLGLRQAGYRVRIVTLGGFEELVRGHGFEHLAIGDSPQEIARTAAGRAWVAKRGSALGFFRGLMRVADALIEEGIAAYWKNSGDVEIIVGSPMSILVGSHIAERLGVPFIQALLAPPIRLSRYDWEGRISFAAIADRALTVGADNALRRLIWMHLCGRTNAARTNILELPSIPFWTLPNPSGNKRVPLLCAYSPALAAKVPDWEETIHVTGYWFLDELPGWQPPSELTDFLAEGPPPVFVGFGSTPFPNPDATTDLVVEALARAGQRGIVVSGGSGLATGRIAGHVIGVESVPHGWLFSRVCAAVHHGGAGVTGAVLRAGLPSVVVPVFADQPFWGGRIFRVGAGPGPIPARRLTQNRLTSALQEALHARIRDRAVALGRTIRAEDGVGCAVEIICRYFGHPNLRTMRQQHAG
jgi:UDP:flavonoid glycosyltransferase YjiC (YdhE family)